MNVKKLLIPITEEPNLWNEITVTLLRVFLGGSMAFAHGLGKFPISEQLVKGVASMGFPLPELFAYAAALSELGGGIFLILGLFTRLSAFFMAFTMAVAAFGVHAADPFRVKELALVYLVTSLFFVARGGGKFSIDRLISK